MVLARAHHFASFLILASYMAFLDAVAHARNLDGPRRQSLFMPVHRNEGRCLDSQLDHGERIVAQLTSEIGAQKTSELLEVFAKREIRRQSRERCLASGVQPSVVDLISDGSEDENDGPINVPYGFWMRFIQDDLNLALSPTRKMRAKRALNAHALRAYQGCQTRMSARGLRHGKSKRSRGGAHNATKTIGLHHALLQYFVDCVGRLMCRADSCMLMEKARELRATLLNDKSGLWNDKNLPKLIGNAGAKWFQRWRCSHGITKKVSGMRLKVSWRKIKKEFVSC